MSTQVYPTLPGIEFNGRLVLMWDTDVRTTPSKREYRSTDQLYARRRRVLSYEFLRSAANYAELQTLGGFFNLHRGALESFLFNDDDDNSVTAQLLGTGDTSNKDFQLARTWGGVVDPVARANSAPLIYKAGALQTLGTHYSLVNGAIYPNDPSVVRFVTAPGAGQAITWTGSYYWRCRFVRDELDLVEFMEQLWKTGTVELLDTRT